MATIEKEMKLLENILHKQILLESMGVNDEVRSKAYYAFMNLQQQARTWPNAPEWTTCVEFNLLKNKEIIQYGLWQ